MKNTNGSVETRFKPGNKPWNTGGFPDWVKKKLSEARMKSEFRTGEKHPKWNGGSRGYYRKFATLTMQESGRDKRCESCNSDKKIHIHHKDRDYKNNQISNLSYLCLSCHIKLHHKEDLKDRTCQLCHKNFKSRLPCKFCSTNCRVKDWKQRRMSREEI